MSYDEKMALNEDALAAEIGRRTKTVAFDYSLKHLLLVAGVQGSGKTTMVSELTRRRLAPEILSALPNDVWTWSVVGNKEPHWLKRLFRRRPEKPRGQIVQKPPRRIDGAFMPLPYLHVDVCDAQHEEFMRLLTAAEEIHVVIVRTPRSQLIQQLAVRSFLTVLPKHMRPMAGRYITHLLRLESALPKWVREHAPKIRGRGWRRRSDLRKCHARLMELYAQEGALDSINHHFEASLAKACGDRLKGSFLYVEPTLGPRGSKSFRLIEQVSKSPISSSCRLRSDIAV